LLHDVTFGNGTFVVVGAGGLILTSPDGTNWAVEVSGVVSRLISVAYQNGRFVTAGESGALLTSDNGHAWSSQSPGALFSPWFLASGHGLFMLESRPGTNLLSADGTNWFPQPSGSDTGLYTIGFGKDRFVSIDIRNRTFTSPDGSNWVAAGTVAIVRPSEIAYGNGHFVTVGGGSLEYSQDGANWNVSPTGDLTGDVAFGNGTFVAVSSSGAIKQSEPVVWLQAAEPGTVDLFGPIGFGCTVEARNALGPDQEWITLTNFTLLSNPHRWTDPERSVFTNRFYRAVLQP
jgi:hypothetical protein